ncbi:hypothetical protein [Kribbella sp. VKM Ac-2568]|nr:hypothetical protein [Kribbella sp. VKM Ac-2568]
MTDSPTPGRHRSSRKAPRRRGLIGPIVSALSTTTTPTGTPMLGSAR